MATPLISTNFGQLLDPRYQKIFYETFEQLPDYIPLVYSSMASNGRDTLRLGAAGALGDWAQWSGSVEYDSASQGYDSTATYLEFVSGIIVDHLLFEDDQFGIIDQLPKGLATAASRTRQKHGARIFINSFSVDTMFYSNSEGVALCSNSHTTNASGVSTSTGFDNLVTTALTAVSVSAARLQGQGLRDDRGNRIGTMFDEIWVPPDLEEKGYEIVASSGKVDTADNNANFHKGRYTLKTWNYLSDTNNWWMCDSAMRKQSLYWIDRKPMEFAFAEDLDTLEAKWRGVMRYSPINNEWRWVIGANVS